MPRETRHEVPWPLSLFNAAWDSKSPDPLPDLTGVFDHWDSHDPWWRWDVSAAEVDEELTELWHHQEVRHVRGAVRHRSTSWSGVPYQDVTGERDTAVHDRNSSWFSPLTHRIPLPRRPRFVRRYGDPTNHHHGSDSQWFGVDRDRGLMFEATAIGEQVLPIPRPWALGNLRTLDLTVPPDNGVNRRAATVANVPMVPLLARPEEFGAGRVDHVQHFVIGALHGSPTGRDNRYSNEPQWPATDTDGTIPGHPFRAGMWLRMRTEVEPPAGATDDELADIDAQKRHGLVVTDVTAASAGHSIRRACGPSSQIRLGLDFSVHDYEVVTVTN